MSRNIQSSSQLNRDLCKDRVDRIVSRILIFVLASSCGSTVFARSLAEGVAVVRKQLPSLTSIGLQFDIGILRGQAVTQNRGMPPHPPASQAIRPEPPQSRSAREARVVRLELNLRDGVTLVPGESVQLLAVPMDGMGNPVHGVAAEWRSLNSQMVAVSEQGEAKALAVGVAPVTATIGQNSVTLLITVGPRATASRNKEHPSRSARNVTEKSPSRSQQTASNKSSLFAHSSLRTAVAPLLQIGFDDAEQLYEPHNAVGAPPGKTTPGASTTGAAIETTETPGSANFSFGLGVVSLPGTSNMTHSAALRMSGKLSRRRPSQPPTLLPETISGRAS